MAQELTKTKPKGAKDKKAGNLVISILSGQSTLLHMLQTSSRNNPKYAEYAKTLQQAHVDLFNAVQDNGINVDGRGMLGVYHIIEELGGLNQ